MDRLTRTGQGHRARKKKKSLQPLSWFEFFSTKVTPDHIYLAEGGGEYLEKWGGKGRAVKEGPGLRAVWGM